MSFNFNDLPNAQKRLLEAFAKALSSDPVSADEVSLASEALPFIAMSGRLGELMSFANDLTMFPPVEAPEIWQGRKNALGETPGDFIARVYEPWLLKQVIHQGDIRKLNERLMIDYVSWVRSNEPPKIVQDNFFTIKEYNTRKLAEFESLPAAEKRRLSVVRTGRTRRAC